jgi:Lrp/AsnC family transcriptional regulator, leucine-responsive regulatory protein
MRDGPSVPSSNRVPPTVPIVPVAVSVCFVDQPDPDVPAVQPVAALTDPIDLRIATALVADGRSTLKALSEITGLSVSAVQARVRRLESGGVIRGYTALVDAESVGLPLAALIAITPLDPAQPDDAPERLAGLPEIEACHSVAGEDAYVLFVRVASPTALEGLIRDIRRRANVSTRTTVVLQTFFERPAAPRETAPSP